MRATVSNAVDSIDYMRAQPNSSSSQELFVTHRTQLAALEADHALVEVEKSGGGVVELQVTMQELVELNQPQVCILASALR